MQYDNCVPISSFGRRIRRDDVVQRRGSVVDESDPDGVVVGVGGARDLPRPEVFVVGSPRRVVAGTPAADQVGFGDDRHELARAGRPGTARPDGVWLGRVEHAGSVQRRRGPESRVDQEAVVDRGERIDLVDVGRQDTAADCDSPTARTAFGLSRSIDPSPDQLTDLRVRCRRRRRRPGGSGANSVRDPGLSATCRRRPGFRRPRPRPVAPRPRRRRSPRGRSRDEP